VASLWAQRLPLVASMSRSTSFGVRCSRVRRSRFGRRSGVTVRFTMAGRTSLRRGFFIEIKPSVNALYEQSTLYEQFFPVQCHL
jgi:hypothetical protein